MVGIVVEIGEGIAKKSDGIAQLAARSIVLILRSGVVLSKGCSCTGTEANHQKWAARIKESGLGPLRMDGGAAGDVAGRMQWWW